MSTGGRRWSCSGLGNICGGDSGWLWRRGHCACMQSPSARPDAAGMSLPSKYKALQNIMVRPSNPLWSPNTTHFSAAAFALHCPKMICMTGSEEICTWGCNRCGYTNACACDRNARSCTHSAHHQCTHLPRLQQQISSSMKEPVKKLRHSPSLGQIKEHRPLHREAYQQLEVQELLMLLHLLGRA